LLTGSTPFDRKELIESGLDAMRKTIREREPPRPSTRLTQQLVAASHKSAAELTGDNGGALTSRRNTSSKEQIHSDLDGIVLKALEKDRARRYQTANALAADIQRHLRHEPVIARPPSPLYLFRKTLRRNRAAFAVAAAVALLLVTGTVFSLRDAVHTRRQ